MSVNSYLSDLASSLVISSSEKNTIDVSISTLESRLTLFFGNDVTRKILFGSYTRDTILPRKADENSDIDYMVVFSNPNNYSPQTFLSKLKSFAEYYYNRSEIYQSNPTIVLELSHIKFELVPAKSENSFLYIPNKSGSWMYTNPNGFNLELIDCNKNNGYKIKPVIRLMKLWNINSNNRDIASFEMEMKLASDLKFANYSCTNYTDYLTKSFDSIRTYNNCSKVDAAKKHITTALEFEANGMPYSSLAEIKKAFPEV